MVQKQRARLGRSEEHPAGLAGIQKGGGWETEEDVLQQLGRKSEDVRGACIGREVVEGEVWGGREQCCEVGHGVEGGTDFKGRHVVRWC